MTETVPRSSPYAGEGLISDESYLRKLPVALTIEERMRCDAIVTAADIITQSFGLMRQFTAQAKAETKNFDNGLRAFLLSLCWTIVDQLHAIRQLLKAKKQGPLTLAFRDASAAATLLRNAMDHLAGNLKNVSSAKGHKNPLFGSLSYFHASDADSAANGGDIITIMSGALHGKDLFPMINPAGQSFTLPTGLFTFSAFGQQLEFGHVIGTLRDLLRKMESSMESDIRTQVEDRAKTPDDIEQAMATLGGGLVLIATISFVSAEEIGVVETAADFLTRGAGKARPEDMLPFLDRAKREAPPAGGEI